MGVELRVGVLTVSDAGSRGQREDTAGPAIAELLDPLGAKIVEKAIVPDEPDQITAQLRAWIDNAGVNCVITTGGTGLGPRDITPEATRPVIDREVPGLAEVMRAAGLRHTPKAALSRGLAGATGSTLILNLPGSEKGVRENLAAVLPLLPHAVELLAGQTEHPAGAD
ncbi:MAG: Molybdopterin biosynthesis enzyme MoaB [Chloroflexi bacterium]|jgi:molybdopterin adenylyltransferase|nr:MAG: Molybdopterin biosynthesis enzyme MoaB [Chloroflexota bacterium]